MMINGGNNSGKSCIISDITGGNKTAARASDILGGINNGNDSSKGDIIGVINGRNVGSNGNNEVA